ncbi:MAG: COX15/CtaA family protein, partial [Turneriella sp.]|nr:COX15/CtaA family protein [Turneriella sp.]
GAGCGEHWPTCEGEVLPTDLARNQAKAIEFSHRASSALSGILVFVLLAGCWHMRGKNPMAWRLALWSFIFILAEGLIGASLVLFRWVGMDDSLGRAVMMPLHLANTYFLLSALTLASAALYGKKLQLTKDRAIVAGAVLLLFTGASGAIAALGDTLFPRTRGVIMEGHAYLRLRNLHPVLAVLATAHILVVATRRNDGYAIFWKRFTICEIVATLAALQAIIGIANIALSAPGWLQLVHLFQSDVLWISYTLWLTEVRRQTTEDRRQNR